jgi:hypothetical protein
LGVGVPVATRASSRRQFTNDDGHGVVEQLPRSEPALITPLRDGQRSTVSGSIAPVATDGSASPVLPASGGLHPAGRWRNRKEQGNEQASSAKFVGKRWLPNWENVRFSPMKCLAMHAGTWRPLDVAAGGYTCIPWSKAKNSSSSAPGGAVLAAFPSRPSH